MAAINITPALVVFVFAVAINGQYDYQPNWDSLESRPLPPWFDNSKFGIFIHWGVFSVPGFSPSLSSSAEWFWERWRTEGIKEEVEFMNDNYRPDFTYADFASQFTAEFFDPNEWADIFEASGAKYIVLTSKHHEGFTMWPSNVSFNWNAMDVGPKRDLVGDLAAAIRTRTDIHFGMYHSMYEWYNQMYLLDKHSGHQTQYFVEGKVTPALHEIVNTYKPDLIWSDGEWEAPDTYWNSTAFLAWLYNSSPVKDTVVVNDRWGAGLECKRGGYLNCKDNYDPGVIQSRKWERCMPMDKLSWGYRRKAQSPEIQSLLDLITGLTRTVSCGGNLLLNIGPTHDGRIIPIFEERLRQMGGWLKVNGEAIYASKPWKYQNDTLNSDVWYTSRKSSASKTDVYAIVLAWPKGNILTLGAPATTTNTEVTMLGYQGNIKWSSRGTQGMTISLPIMDVNTTPSTVAWVLKLQNLAQ